MCVCVCACACVRVRVRVRVCVRACVCMYVYSYVCGTADTMFVYVIRTLHLPFPGLTCTSTLCLQWNCSCVHVVRGACSRRTDM